MGEMYTVEAAYCNIVGDGKLCCNKRLLHYPARRLLQRFPLVMQCPARRLLQHFPYRVAISGVPLIATFPLFVMQYPALVIATFLFIYIYYFYAEFSVAQFCI